MANVSKTNVSELRGKPEAELNEVLVSLLRDQFNYRMQKTTGQLNQTHLLAVVRKDIARVKTVIGEKQAEVKTGAPEVSEEKGA